VKPHVDANNSAVDALVDHFLESHDFRAMRRLEFLNARFDAGLAMVEKPEGLGGLSLSADAQKRVESRFDRAGAPDNDPLSININIGQAIPALMFAGTDEQKRDLIRPLWTGELVCCQLFSEPDAGSDLASVRTRAIKVQDGWRVSGHKIWTSLAHKADLAILLARTSTEGRAHDGLTYFLIDMRQPGVQIEPLRQITGQAEFNEVFLSDAFVPEGYAIGEVNGGWAVAMATLESERAFYGVRQLPRESGMIGELCREWRTQRHLHAADGFDDRVCRAWIDAEVFRIANIRLSERMAAGENASEASGSKIRFAQLNQEIAWLRLELAGAEVGRTADYAFSRPERTEFLSAEPIFSYLRSRANSIEGGTTEIMKNVIADRVLNLPRR